MKNNKISRRDFLKSIARYTIITGLCSSIFIFSKNKRLKLLRKVGSGIDCNNCSLFESCTKTNALLTKKIKINEGKSLK